MKRRDFLLSAGAALAASTFPCRWTPAADGQRRKVLYYTCSAGFEHSVVKRSGSDLAHSEKIFIELGAKNGFDVTCTKDGTVFDTDLPKYDVIAFYTSGDLTKPDKYGNPPMTPEGKQKLLDAIAAGKGFMGFHSANDSFHSPGARDENQTDVDPYLAMLGGEFITHGRQQEATVRTTSLDFPGAKDVGQSYRVNEEWYALKNFAPDLHVIEVLDTQGMADACYQRPPFPFTWARRHKQGRVWYTGFGHREDIWTNPKIQGLILGGLAWTSGNVPFDVPANLDKAAPGGTTIPKLPPPTPKKPAEKKEKKKE